MSKTLVVVESPAKAKTIKKYLGAGYEVLASKGHVKDLPKRMGIDVENGFVETYEVIETKAKVLAELKSQSKKVDRLLLATDPDREGEAIAWHIAEELKRPKLDVQRVEFHEITKKGVDKGLNSPRPLDENLYNAQRARRVLDRIVGYDVSALVWNKLAFGLSAGRVQSVALRLIVTARRKSKPSFPRSTGTSASRCAARALTPVLARLVQGRRREDPGQERRAGRQGARRSRERASTASLPSTRASRSATRPLLTRPASSSRMPLPACVLARNAR